MDPTSLGSKMADPAGALAADSRSLDQLKRAARGDPRQAAKQVATQFEAMFMQMVLKSMRDATPKSGLLESQGQDLYQGMLDQQIAQQIASRGTGLSAVIARQLARTMPAAAGAAAGPTSGQPATAVAAPSGTPAAAPAAVPAAPAPVPRAGAASVDAQRAFMQQHASDAQRAQQLTGVPAGFILGQAALESGWGQREIRAADGTPSYNLFGIKAGPGWQGRTVQVTTTEFAGGVPQNSVQSFRAYDSYAAAFQDWALSIGRNQRYAAAAAPGTGAASFAAAMQQAGYSTDPAYAAKLARIIQSASSLGAAT